MSVLVCCYFYVIGFYLFKLVSLGLVELKFIPIGELAFSGTVLLRNFLAMERAEVYFMSKLSAALRILSPPATLAIKASFYGMEYLLYLVDCFVEGFFIKF